MASIRTIDDGTGFASYDETPNYAPPHAETQPYSVPGFMVNNTGFENGGISGYGRTTTAPNSGFQVNNTTSPYMFNQNAFEKAFGDLTGGKSGTLAEWQSSIFPQLQAMFPDIQSFGSKGDKIRLPNGQTIDAVISAGAGGRGYALNYDNPLGGYFSDPLLQGYLNFGQGAIDQLMGGQGINPVLQQAIDALLKTANGPTPHMDAGWIYPLKEAVDKRTAQLNQPGWSPTQLDLLRTQVSDPLEAQKEAARQQIIQRFAAQGMTPSSGIVQQALIDSDRKFGEARTTGERDLASKEMAQDEARKQEAVALQQMLAGFGQSTAQADLQGQLSGRGQTMQAAGQLAGIGSDLQNAPYRNLMAAMGIYGNMAQMPFQSMAAAQSAMNGINGQQVPQYESMAPIISLLMGLANQGEGVYNTAQQNGNSFWNVLGAAMPDLLTAFSGMFKQQPNGGGYSYGGQYQGE